MKFIDASNIMNDVINLFQMFKKIVEWVGSNNIVHMLTNYTTNCMVVGRMIS